MSSVDPRDQEPAIRFNRYSQESHTSDRANGTSVPSDVTDDAEGMEKVLKHQLASTVALNGQPYTVDPAAQAQFAMNAAEASLAKHRGDGAKKHGNKAAQKAHDEAVALAEARVDVAAALKGGNPAEEAPADTVVAGLPIAPDALAAALDASASQSASDSKAQVKADAKSDAPASDAAEPKPEPAQKSAEKQAAAAKSK